MAEYAPDDAEICAQWLSYVTEESPSGDWDALPEVDAVARWNAWLEAHDREVAAKALLVAAEEMGHAEYCNPDPDRDPYVGCACRLTFLLAIADRIERGELQSHP